MVTVQADTALYCAVKNPCLRAKFHGPHFAFSSYLALPCDQTTSEASNEELAGNSPTHSPRG
jgi:hypothetical protein